MNEENKPAYYAIIPSEVRYCEELKFAERLLYGEITALAGKEGYCFATNRYFAELYHVIPGTISRWINHLEALEFVRIEIITDERNQVLERRIYINECNREFIQNTYKQNKQYPYEQNEQYPISRNAKYNNINNNKIDGFFNYIVGKTKKNPEKFTEDEEKEFRALLEKLGFNYKEELIRIFTEENVKKVQIIIYALKRLFTSNRKSLLYKITREELLFIYDKCIEKQLEYENTEDEINNFLDYYYVSLIKSLRKS